MTELYGDPAKRARRILGTHELYLTDDPKDTLPTRQGQLWPPKSHSELTVPCKAITLYPIWAWAIMFAGKKIENRDWPTSYRGRLAIHAGSSRQSEAPDRVFIEALGIRVPAGLPGGAILGTVDLIDCQPYGDAFSYDPWACGKFCWILANPRALAEPIPASGKLSLWTCRLPANFRVDTTP